MRAREPSFFAELKRRSESVRRIAKLPFRVLSPSAPAFVGRVLCFLGYAAAVNLLPAEPPPATAPIVPAGAVTAVPPTVVNGLGILFQVRQRLHERSEEKEEAIREDLALSDSALRVLLVENWKSSAPDRDQITAALQALLQQIVLTQAGGDREILESNMAELQKLYDPQRVEQAHALAQRYRCPMHPDVIGQKGAICPRCGMQLSSQVRLAASLFDAMTATGIVKARVQIDAPLQVGVKVNAHLILTNRRGEAITVDQLREVHTRKIHLLIIDGSLTDYHHEHPVPSNVPGRYDFRFTPQKPGTYRIWADVQPVETDIQEFAMTVIPADTPAEPLHAEPDRLTNTVNGLTYSIQFEKPVKSDEPVRGTLHIARADGSGFARLEPIMGAFAHIVGFREDRTSALHIHPETARPLTASDRGGPDLHFRFYAARPGFYRLFVQVQREGVEEFVPFALNVVPGKMPSGWERNNCSRTRRKRSWSASASGLRSLTLRLKREPDRLGLALAR
jgi:hypothetical protein